MWIDIILDRCVNKKETWKVNLVLEEADFQALHGLIYVSNVLWQL